jgi:hypothetical protein
LNDRNVDAHLSAISRVGGGHENRCACSPSTLRSFAPCARLWDQAQTNDIYYNNCGCELKRPTSPAFAHACENFPPVRRPNRSIQTCQAVRAFFIYTARFNLYSPA